MANTRAKLELEDPLHEKEIYASEISGIAMVQGNFIVTLTTVRYDEPIGGKATKARRIVTGRIVLTNAAASQLLQNLAKHWRSIQAAAAAAAGHKPN